MNKRAHPNVNPIYWIIGHCITHMYSYLQFFTNNLKLSDDILHYTRYGANPKEIEESPPFSVKDLIDTYIKISSKFFEYLNDMSDDEIFRKPSENAGEKWYASINVRNIGEANGHSVYVYLDSSDPYLTFQSSSRNEYYGTINVNQTIVNSDNYYWYNPLISLLINLD